MSRIYLFIVILITFFACDNKKIFDDYYWVDSKGWYKDSIANFDFEIIDNSTNYNLFISTRNLENYSYSNLWLFVDIIAPDSTFVHDTIEYQMAEPNGKWIGKGTGGLYFLQNEYRLNVYFPMTGKYKIDIRHGMRDENLKGLNNIGLRVAKR